MGHNAGMVATDLIQDVCKLVLVLVDARDHFG